MENYIELIESFDKRGKAYKLAVQIRNDDKYKRSIDFSLFFRFFKDRDLTDINKVMKEKFDEKNSEENLSLLPKWKREKSKVWNIIKNWIKNCLIY